MQCKSETDISSKWVNTCKCIGLLRNSFFIYDFETVFKKVYINYQHVSDSALTNEAHLPTHSRIAQNKMFIAYKGSRMLANYFIPPFFVN